MNQRNSIRQQQPSGKAQKLLDFLALDGPQKIFEAEKINLQDFFIRLETCSPSDYHANLSALLRTTNIDKESAIRFAKKIDTNFDTLTQHPDRVSVNNLCYITHTIVNAGIRNHPFISKFSQWLSDNQEGLNDLLVPALHLLPWAVSSKIDQVIRNCFLKIAPCVHELKFRSRQKLLPLVKGLVQDELFITALTGERPPLSNSAQLELEAIKIGFGLESEVNLEALSQTQSGKIPGLSNRMLMSFLQPKRGKELSAFQEELRKEILGRALHGSLDCVKFLMGKGSSRTLPLDKRDVQLLLSVVAFNLEKFTQRELVSLLHDSAKQRVIEPYSQRKILCAVAQASDCKEVTNGFANLENLTKLGYSLLVINCYERPCFDNLCKVALERVNSLAPIEAFTILELMAQCKHPCDDLRDKLWLRLIEEIDSLTTERVSRLSYIAALENNEHSKGRWQLCCNSLEKKNFAHNNKSMRLFTLAGLGLNLSIPTEIRERAIAAIAEVNEENSEQVAAGKFELQVKKELEYGKFNFMHQATCFGYTIDFLVKLSDDKMVALEPGHSWYHKVGGDPDAPTLASDDLRDRVLNRLEIYTARFSKDDWNTAEDSDRADWLGRLMIAA